MSESENNTTPATPTQPVFPPIDATKAVPPVTPFPAWTWNTPVIPQFYWNVYSSEQRIRQICVEIGRIQAYLEYFAANSNAAHWYLDSRFTQVETRLTARVDKLEKELGEEVARLDKALADETKNRVDGDKALQEQIDTTKTALEAETAAREAGDKANADAITKETADREAGDAALRADVDANAKAISKETADRKAGDADLRTDVDANTAAIAQETADRKAGDAALRTDVDANKSAITKETADRKAGDDQLADDLATETNARANADTALGARIDAEATARQDADTHLGERIAAEHTERVHDVQTLTTGMNRRPLATAITAKEGSGVTVESKETDDGSGTGVVIGSTWQGDFTAMRNDLTAETAARTNADGALEAKLDAETGERRHDDAELGRRIDGKLAFGAVRAGDGITVVNDPDATTATVSAEVTKAKLDEAIAGIPAYKLPAATAERLGGVKVGTGLTVTDDGTLNAAGTVSHDDTMDGDGTAGNPLKVRPATATTPGVVRPVQGLTVWDDGSLYVKHGNGLVFNSGNELEAKLGEGLAFNSDGAITATGAAGTSESVKVVYPQSTQTALGVDNTSGKRSVGEFLNFFAGVDKKGLPAPRFDVKCLEITKKQLTDAMGRKFQPSDFTTVNGGYFNGTTAMRNDLSPILNTVLALYDYRIASIVVVDFNANNSGSMVIDGYSIITYFTSTDRESLANTLNSIGDNIPVYVLYCVRAYSETLDTAPLDIYSRGN